jgi:uncharacterized membrane protein
VSIRRAIKRSPVALALCVLLLVLFALLCGLHLAGDVHGDLHGLGFADAIGTTFLLLSSLLSFVGTRLLSTTCRTRILTHSVGSLYAVTGRPHSTSSVHLPLRR